MYRRDTATVNQHHRPAAYGRQCLGVTAVAWLLLAGAGCSAPKSVAARPTYFVAFRYDVEPEFVRLGPVAAVDGIRSDFKRAAELGFDSVVLRHLDRRDEPVVLDLAIDERLAPLVSSRTVQHYIRTGAWPADIANTTELVEQHMANRRAASRSYVTLVDGSECKASAARANQIVGTARQLGVHCLALGDSVLGSGANSLAVIATTDGTARNSGSRTERWLGQYHHDLLLGKTGGIVVDRYRRLPGDPSGLASDGAPMPAAQAAALRTLVMRVRRWAPHVHRSTVQPVDATVSADADIRVVSLELGKRRHLLIFNPSADQYARGDVSLPESIGGSTLIRAVEVPSSDTAPAGLVLYPVRGRIVVNVALRPGDAALFELF